MNSVSEFPESLILESTSARAIVHTEIIESLWSGNGSIVRVFLDGGTFDSVIFKCIRPNKTNRHPRGWNTDASFQRKLRSYSVEANWYREYAKHCPLVCAVPKFLVDHVLDDARWIVLEDLDNTYPVRHEQLTMDSAQVCIHWLAHFHGCFFDHAGEGLWPIGTYWHLATRRDEFNAMEEGELKDAATALDARLNQCRYKTLVHGDAKVANFCFSKEGDRVAAVDFQYVGRGCGMKDLVYFMGSIMDEESCAKYSELILDEYFSVITTYLTQDLAQLVENEWRELYPVAWADFHRFLSGWMPEHKKINRYTQQMTNTALRLLTESL